MWIWCWMRPLYLPRASNIFDLDFVWHIDFNQFAHTGRPPETFYSVNIYLVFMVIYLEFYWFESKQKPSVIFKWTSHYYHINNGLYRYCFHRNAQSSGGSSSYNKESHSYRHFSLRICSIINARDLWKIIN